MSGAAPHAAGKPNGAPPPPAPPSAPASTDAEQLAGFLRHELERCAGRFEGFELIQRAALRPDTLIQPFGSVDVKSVGDLARRILDRAEHETQHAPDRGASYAVVSRPDGARFGITSRTFAPASPTEAGSQALSVMIGEFGRHSTEASEVTRDVIAVFAKQRVSEQEGYKLLLDTALALSNNTTKSHESVIKELRALVATLMGERTELVNDAVKALGMVREMETQKAEHELEARREERRYQMRSKFIEEVVPVVKGKLLHALIAKDILPKEMLSLIGAPAASTEKKAQHQFTARQLDAIGVFLATLQPEEYAKLIDVLGEASRAALQAVVVAMTEGVKPS